MTKGSIRPLGLARSAKISVSPLSILQTSVEQKRCVISPYSRAKELTSTSTQTAERIAAHHAPLTVQVVPALKEQYWGSAQGLRLDPGDPLPVDMETQEQ